MSFLSTGARGDSRAHNGCCTRCCLMQPSPPGTTTDVHPTIAQSHAMQKLAEKHATDTKNPKVKRTDMHNGNQYRVPGCAAARRWLWWGAQHVELATRVFHQCIKTVNLCPHHVDFSAGCECLSSNAVATLVLSSVISCTHNGVHIPSST
eukprot:m.556083 g.556083  ORF g.556083 m.556083 type:complete len:150 (-) comp22184_c0_seq27:804-1253(-)